MDLFDSVSRYMSWSHPMGIGEVTQWKKGFYMIAMESRRSLLPASFIDYGNKIRGIGLSWLRGGICDKDLIFIQDFYRGMKRNILRDSVYPKPEQGKIRFS